MPMVGYLDLNWVIEVSFVFCIPGEFSNFNMKLRYEFNFGLVAQFKCTLPEYQWYEIWFDSQQHFLFLAFKTVTICCFGLF